MALIATDGSFSKSNDILVGLFFGEPDLGLLDFLGLCGRLGDVDMLVPN